jgi:hypothetical protein
VRTALAGILLATALAAGAAGPPVAFVADVRGSATIEGNGRLGFLAELAPGARLLLGTGAAATITFASSGSEFTIEGPGEFSIGIGEVKADKGAAPPKRRSVSALGDLGVVSRISRTATASLRMRSMTPTPDPAALEYPVNTRIFALQPSMKVRGVPADSKITILDGNGKTVWSGPVGPVRREGTRIGVKLAPGTRYGWNATTERGTLGPGSFETLSANEIARVEKSRKGKEFPERVVSAILLQELGATQDAKEAWEELARERPDLQELAALAR